MVPLSYPGVYVVEVPSGVHTITGVATSVGAFLGRTGKGPVNKAVRILSLADYVRTFGKPHPNSDLAQSVRQFFENGGTDCYVVRLARNAAKAAVTLRSIRNEPVLVFTARTEGLWANTVRLEVDYNTPNPDDTFNLRVIQEEAGVPVATENHPNLSMNPTSPRFAPTFITQSSALVDVKVDVAAMGDPSLPGSFINNIANSFAGFSQSRRGLGTTVAQINTLLATTLPGLSQSTFEISVNGGGFVPVSLTGWPSPAAFAGIEGELVTRINTALLANTPVETVGVTTPTVAGLGRVIQITSASGDRSAVRVRRSSSNDVAAALMLGTEQGGIEGTRWSNFRPVPTGSFLRLGAAAVLGDLATVDAIANFLQSDITEVIVDNLPPVGLNVGPVGAPGNIISSAAGNGWFKNKPNDSLVTGDNDGVREKLRIMAANINATPNLPWRAEVWGYHLAVIARAGAANAPVNAQPATLSAGARPAAVHVPNASFNGGLTINVRQYTLGTAGTGPFSTAGVAGDDGQAPGVAEYIGNEVTQTGMHALDPVDLFNLMVLPSDAEVDAAAMLAVVGPASVYCQQRRAFLLIDAPVNWTNNGLAAVVNNTALVTTLKNAGVVKDYSAVFYPRLRYSDLGVLKYIGPSGAIAGLMARIDSTRGVWKAPAGVEADLRGVLDLEVNLTDRENGVLNKLGVNCSRKFPSGIVNWGARTLAGADDDGSEWKYIPIRRLALFLEESLYRGTKWVVFEPNDEPLWAKVRMNLNAFMMGLFRQGAFQGSTPDAAFYVKCDAETTTQADRNLGIVNIEVGFAPLKPAEFVVIKIQQIAGDLG